MTFVEAREKGHSYLEVSKNTAIRVSLRLQRPRERVMCAQDGVRYAGCELDLKPKALLEKSGVRTDEVVYKGNFFGGTCASPWTCA